MLFVLPFFDRLRCVRIVSSSWQPFLAPSLAIGVFDDREPFFCVFNPKTEIKTRAKRKHAREIR